MKKIGLVFLSYLFLLPLAAHAQGKSARILSDKEHKEEIEYQRQKREYLKKYMKDPSQLDKAPQQDPNFVSANSNQQPLAGPGLPAKEFNEIMESETIDFNTFNMQKLSHMSQKQLLEFTNKVNKQKAALLEKQQELIEQSGIDPSELEDKVRNIMEKKIGSANGLQEFAYASIETFQKLDKETLKKHVINTAKNGPFEKVFGKCPQCLEFSVEFLKDDKAFKGLVDITKDREKLIHFLIANVVLFVLNMLLRTMVGRHLGTFFERLKFWFVRATIFISLRIGLVVYYFGENLEPTWNLFQDSFLT